MKATIRGMEQLSEAIRPLVERVENPEPALEFIGILGERASRRNIDRQASPEGEPYAPTDRGGTILRDTGILYGGITHAVEGRTVLIGAGAASSAYNAYQQFGSADYDGESGNPPRPFIGISEADADEMIEEVADFVTGDVA